MLSLDLIFKDIEGADVASWPFIQNFELYLYPLTIDVSTSLYKDIYHFIFPKSCDDTGLVVNKRLKPVRKRPRMPHFYN